MTLRALQGKAASVVGSASIGPIPKTGGKEVPPSDSLISLLLPSLSESIRATRASRGWHRAPPTA